MLRRCCFASSGVFCNPSIPVALGNLCSSESPSLSRRTRRGIRAVPGSSWKRKLGATSLWKQEKEGFDSAASIFWKTQRTAVFSLRKTSFPRIPWCLGRGGTAGTRLLGKSRQGMLPAACVGTLWIQGAEPGTCTESLPSFPFWMDVEVKEYCNSLWERRGLENV